jgi:anti-sigma-K factor RskA
MIDEQHQDLACAYVLNTLNAHATDGFEAELACDPELREFVDGLRETAAQLAHAASRGLPSPQLRERAMSAIQAEAAALPAPATVQSTGRNLLPWALAAGFALTTAALWLERDQWRSEALTLRQTSLDLRNRDSLAEVKIASLTAQMEAFSKGTAIVVWDPGKQRGVIRLANLPRPEAGKDYQLWVIDPKYPQPIDGGIVPVDQDGYARVSFTAKKRVKKADKFAISVEPTGGMPQATGPIVLLSN